MYSAFDSAYHCSDWMLAVMVVVELVAIDLFSYICFISISKTLFYFIRFDNNQACHVSRLRTRHVLVYYIWSTSQVYCIPMCIRIGRIKCVSAYKITYLFRSIWTDTFYSFFLIFLFINSFSSSFHKFGSIIFCLDSVSLRLFHQFMLKIVNIKSNSIENPWLASPHCRWKIIS